MSAALPDPILAHFAARYGVPPAYGERFRPLVTRALAARPEVRERILALVETSFQREAERLERVQASRPVPPDWAAVRKVARILHTWNPPDWLLAWGELPEADPDLAG